MKNYYLFSTKAILVIALFFLTTTSYSQKQKASYKLKYKTGSGKSIEGELVTHTFFLLNVVENADCESFATLLRAQDGVKNVKISPVSAENNALLAITFSKNFKAELVQNLLKKVGIVEIIIDDVPVPIDNMFTYISNLKKQKQANK
ncbi:MAG TPA: hypothetical protein VJI69_05390 [Bacteroidia bacterium]|nr:hypothetical protein [Bacteroidia bacterium]